MINDNVIKDKIWNYEHITRGVSYMNILYDILWEVVHEFAANTTNCALWLEILEISRNSLDPKSMSVRS